jgi:hypothetical protein
METPDRLYNIILLSQRSGWNWDQRSIFIFQKMFITHKNRATNCDFLGSFLWSVVATSRIVAFFFPRVWVVICEKFQIKNLSLEWLAQYWDLLVDVGKSSWLLCGETFPDYVHLISTGSVCTDLLIGLIMGKKCIYVHCPRSTLFIGYHYLHSLYLFPVLMWSLNSDTTPLTMHFEVYVSKILLNL